MNVRHLKVIVSGQRIFARVAVGHTTIPLVHLLEIDPAQALAFAGQLEASVHAAQAAQAQESQAADTAASTPAEVAAASALPMDDPFHTKP